LQSALKQQATTLKEKEFNLHHSNMSEFRKPKEEMEGQVIDSYSSRLSVDHSQKCLIVFSSQWLKKNSKHYCSDGRHTIAAVSAGLDITMFIEFNPPDDSTWVRNSSCLTM
jgi:hypothetical protein